MLYSAAWNVQLAATVPAWLAVAAALLGFLEAAVEDMPEWFTEPPVWPDFPHPAAARRWNPERPAGGTITIPIP